VVLLDINCSYFDACHHYRRRHHSLSI
jgi:hypothetical protein